MQPIGLESKAAATLNEGNIMLSSLRRELSKYCEKILGGGGGGGGGGQLQGNFRGRFMRRTSPFPGH